MGQTDYVDIFRIRFPRYTQHQALSKLKERFEANTSTSVCFIDMSAMNQTFKHPKLRDIYKRRSFPLNDGVGMALAAWQRGKPFPENLNGTDLCPMFLRTLPEGTKVYLVGSFPDLIRKARYTFDRQYPNLQFVGMHHGYIDEKGENEVIEEVKRLQPKIVLVGMGNPKQAEFIDRYIDDPELKGVMWFAIGGLLHYFSGDLQRAPESFRRNKLEWLYILCQQPYKILRYLFGIPVFLLRVCWACIRNQHHKE